MVREINYKRIDKLYNDLEIASQVGQLAMVDSKAKAQNIHTSLQYIEAVRSTIVLIEEWDQEDPFEFFLEQKVEEAKQELQKAIDGR